MKEKWQVDRGKLLRSGENVALGWKVVVVSSFDERIIIGLPRFLWRFFDLKGFVAIITRREGVKYFEKLNLYNSRGICGNCLVECNWNSKIRILTYQIGSDG